MIKEALLLALGEVAYIMLVATFLYNANKIFPQEDNKFLAPITFLTLLVLSVAVSGGLVLGRPVLMYLDGKKKQAVEIFIFILGWLFVFFLLFAAALIIFR